MGQIGQSCRQLRSLDVSSTSISDRGLELLSRKTEGDPPSQLTRLLLTDTYTSHYVLPYSTIYLYSYTIHVRVIQASNDVNIFSRAIQGIATALRRLPQLRQLEYEFIFQVFDHLTELGGDEAALELLMEEEEDEPSTLQPYRLISLKSSDPLNNSENLVTAIRLCPELQAIALTSGASFQESSLWNLTRLNQLCDLSLTNGPSAYPLDFYNSVVPVLEAIGHQLNNLILNRFAIVDVHGISVYT